MSLTIFPNLAVIENSNTSNNKTHCTVTTSTPSIIKKLHLPSITKRSYSLKGSSPLIRGELSKGIFLKIFVMICFRFLKEWYVKHETPATGSFLLSLLCPLSFSALPVSSVQIELSKLNCETVDFICQILMIRKHLCRLRSWC